MDLLLKGMLTEDRILLHHSQTVVLRPRNGLHEQVQRRRPVRKGEDPDGTGAILSLGYDSRTAVSGN